MLTVHQKLRLFDGTPFQRTAPDCIGVWYFEWAHASAPEGKCCSAGLRHANLAELDGGEWPWAFAQLRRQIASRYDLAETAVEIVPCPAECGCCERALDLICHRQHMDELAEQAADYFLATRAATDAPEERPAANPAHLN